MSEPLRRERKMLLLICTLVLLGVMFTLLGAGIAMATGNAFVVHLGLSLIVTALIVSCAGSLFLMWRK